MAPNFRVPGRVRLKLLTVSKCKTHVDHSGHYTHLPEDDLTPEALWVLRWFSHKSRSGHKNKLNKRSKDQKSAKPQ